MRLWKVARHNEHYVSILGISGLTAIEVVKCSHDIAISNDDEAATEAALVLLRLRIDQAIPEDCDDRLSGRRYRAL